MEINVRYLADSGTDSSLTETVLVVTAVVRLAITRLQEVVLVESIGHRHTDAETPAVGRAPLPEPVRARLYRDVSLFV